MTEEYRPGGLKWTYHEPDVLPMWVAEMDYPLAPAIAEALHAAVEDGLTGYPYPQIEQATFDAATAFWSSHLDWDVDSTWVFSAPDVIEGTRRAIEKLTTPDSPVVLHTPVYFPFFGMVERAGRQVVEVPSGRDDRGLHRLDFEGIERAFADGAGCIVLCSPWNPTGRVFESSELETLTDIARTHGARVISDEIHAPITYPGQRHIPASKIDPEVVVTVTSASKTFDLPGLKAAQIVLTNPEDRELWFRYFTPEKVGVGTFGLIASRVAYAKSVDWYLETLAQLDGNRRLLAKLLSDRLPRIRTTDVQATYLAWLDFSDYEIDDPAGFLLEHARVALTGGGPFRGSSVQHARLNFASTESRLVEAVDRIAGALANR